MIKFEYLVQEKFIFALLKICASIKEKIEAIMKTYAAALLASLFLFSSVSIAAPYAAIVINAKDGKVLHCEECDKKLHPAGLTKLLTLYVVFSKIESGEFDLDDKVTVSRK